MSTQGSQWVAESPQQYSEGDTPQFAFKWPATVTAAASTCYRNGTDITSTALSGSDTYSGDVSVMKTCTIQSGHGGSKYVLEHQVTTGGIVESALIEFIIRKAGAEQS